MNEAETFTVSSAISVPRDHQSGTIYFISCDYADFPIKIGFATELRKRLHGIQTSLPYEVVLLAQMPGNRRFERRLFRQFEEFRLRGEWFRRVEPLLRTIDLVKADRPIQWRPELDPWRSPEYAAHIRGLMNHIARD